MRSPHEVILHPLRTEKGVAAEAQGKYQFRVLHDANKVEIRQAVETIYKVKVRQVNTTITRGKMRRIRYHYGKSPDVKKAIVTLQQGQTIENL
jgi:large subunit ribosomal protein L23